MATGPAARFLDQRRGGFARTQHPALGGALPAGQHRGEHAVGDGLLQRVQDLDPGHEVGGVVGDAFDPVRVEDLGLHQAHPLDTEVLRDPYRAGDVDDVLRIDEDEDGAARAAGRRGVLADEILRCALPHPLPRCPAAPL